MNRDRIEGNGKQLAGRARGPVMKRAWPVVIASSLALVGAIGTGCASTSSQPGNATTKAQPAKESTGEYVDNTVITTKVKSAFLAEPALKSLQINVKTFKDVVQLSGFVDSAQSVALAGKIAADVQGVTSVRNDLIVK